MKVKTSVTLSEDVLKAIDQLPGGKTNRSAVIERAVREHVLAHAKRVRDERDLRIYEEHQDELNREAMDALGFQVPL
jgi:metal-responsive CopG/Arc/MetJ family transcriptional regulator